MHSLSFTLGDLKVICGCPLIDFLDALLQLTLCCALVFGSGSETKVINSQIQELGDVVYVEEGQQQYTPLMNSFIFIMEI